MSFIIAEMIRKWSKLFYVMLTRDVRSIFLLFTFQIKMFWYKRKNRIMLHFFDENVRKFPNKTAIIYNGEHYTFEYVSNLANRISNWIESTLKFGHDDQWESLNQVSVIGNNDNDNVNKKETMIESKIYQKFDDNLQTTQIGLMLGNIPEIASFIIGISRVRCSAVMFNTNHRLDTLINAFNATNCRIFIFERKYFDTIKDVAEQLPDIKFFMYDRDAIKQKQSPTELLSIDFNYNGISRDDLMMINNNDDDDDADSIIERAIQFSRLLQLYPIVSVKKTYPYKFTDKMIYIFTSGTTGGNIKASPADNVRQIASYFSQCRAFEINHNDNVYICLPCYHSFAGITGLGYMFIGGTTITLADKFSASKFWKDCCQYQCTAAIYIGETCRYLLAQPHRPEETKHTLRIMMGPGMKREIWREFQTRFHIRRIGEYYGSTEGNVQTFNMTNVEGSCGFIPYYYGFLCKFFFHVYLIKVDPETMELERDRYGLCKFARPGETGMLVGQIRPGHSFSEFLGYTSTQESTKKIVRNVRSKGDFAFVSGDLMEMDFYGNLYFKDRTGDTFRWKGENVSTTEIEDIISQFTNHSDCVVYGVTVPHCDGRAGMLATNDRQLDLNGFHQFMRARVPDYAIPKFIRITDDIQMTSTLKFIKYPLRKVGFDYSQMKPDDQLYYFDRQQSKYLLMDDETYERINNGQIKIS
ncbi:hypothetical protein DERF_014846 [Dermatophagoides farinae]|uniref:Long-chain-fatty-acid--CoA ligase n=1 Tax=Dermatophagoides farinae TaxID=6954 RepID=A0A922HQ12_DERFA|nr:hypothetical protein DERF_014846 [Dermatophagoides farinae]